jgi:hypothetical protein
MPHNPPLERPAAAVYFACGQASRVRRRGRSTALRYPASTLMTIYVPKLRELPPAEMARLDPAAKFSERRTAGRLTAYVYDWPDMRVVVNLLPEAELPAHLEQFVWWLEDRAQSLGKTLSGQLAARIHSTTLVLGFVVEKATDREVWHDRVQDMIGMICFNTKSIVFWEGMIFDENCTQLWPPVG